MSYNCYNAFSIGKLKKSVAKLLFTHTLNFNMHAITPHTLYAHWERLILVSTVLRNKQNVIMYRGRMHVLTIFYQKSRNTLVSNILEQRIITWKLHIKMYWMQNALSNVINQTLGCIFGLLSSSHTNQFIVFVCKLVFNIQQRKPKLVF
jgi:hypothetical protein